MDRWPVVMAVVEDRTNAGTLVVVVLASAANAIQWQVLLALAAKGMTGAIQLNAKVQFSHARVITSVCW